MIKEKSLLVLAAGMGSRYGGLKQMDGFGPNDETIIDYSIYDAMLAGFTKIVFVIRENFRDQFVELFDRKYADKIDLAYVTQELDKIPEGYKYHLEREKPWGTMHAVLMAKEVIKEPFAVINADDYYGRQAYVTAADFLEENADGNVHAVISYFLKNTLSEHGTVNRGVCTINDEGMLMDIEECTKIGFNDDKKIVFPTDNGKMMELEPDTLVSMNLFAFYPNIFEKTMDVFEKFLEERGMELKSEFYIPTALDALINSNQIKIRVLSSPSKWFGVTYKEDKPQVVKRLEKLIQDGVYPEQLWK